MVHIHPNILKKGLSTKFFTSFPMVKLGNLFLLNRFSSSLSCFQWLYNSIDKRVYPLLPFATPHVYIHHYFFISVSIQSLYALFQKGINIRAISMLNTKEMPWEVKRSMLLQTTPFTVFSLRDDIKIN